MAIKDLPKYKDIRGTIRRNGRYPIAKVGSLVGIKAKDTHVIHHSMTAQHLKGSTPQAFANTHIEANKWQGIAYAFVIMPDGTIYQCDDLDRRTNHAGNTNDISIGTCVIGDFRKEGEAEKPTQDQIISLFLLNKELFKEIPSMKHVIGHQECPGYAWKNCPGDTWDYKKVITGEGLMNVKEEDIMSQPLNPTNPALNKAVQNVLLKFEQDKDQPLSCQWREKFEKRELTISDAVGLLYVAAERGYLNR
ncbi:N-acetylmuramoyl-L-alanine amidase [Cytobacillus depressus]|uniref:Autolysin n=1 Tax=Cytobacillus depressus TaxID=1602942 RepID=A0A6L3V0S8_9BACI|nr:peptidoglycan recognition family protein [Cytobacillus depressus]KAB2329596.1 N-acetylmuramoyl-L-alanine amidase [Cytobacillus depressus]